MKNWKRLLALLLSLALIVSLCACNSGEQADNSEPPDPDTSLDPDNSSAEVDLSRDVLDYSAGLSAGDTLLTVNGVEIKADLLLYWLALSCSNFTSYYGMLGYELTDNIGNGTTFADQMRVSAVDIATYNVLLRQKATELGCLLTDEQRSELNGLMTADPDTIEEVKALYGVTDETIEYVYAINYYYSNVLDAVVPTVTDEMLNGYVYQAKHILLMTVDSEGEAVLQEDGTYAYPALPAETVAEKRKQAEDILAQIRAADDPIAKFDELMNEFSEDGRDEETGELYSPDGYTTTLGEMVPGFEQGALALKPGEISGIVESSWGYHIILRGEVADLDSYAEDYREYQVDQVIDAMLETAEITRAPALDALDVAGFFDRYVAYQAAFMEQREAADGSDGDAVG